MPLKGNLGPHALSVYSIYEPLYQAPSLLCQEEQHCTLLRPGQPEVWHALMSRNHDAVDKEALPTHCQSLRRHTYSQLSHMTA